LPYELTLFVHALAHDGRGIARSDDSRTQGRVIFVAGALPGDTARARVTRAKKALLEAETLEFISRGETTSPYCQHWRSCGGCPLQRMPYPEQLRWKKRLTRDNLTRIGRIDPTLLDEIFTNVEPSPALRHFRNKMEFAFGADTNGNLVLGLREARSGQILSVPDCALMPPSALNPAQRAAQLARAGGLPPYGHNRKGFWRFLTIRQSYAPESDNLWLCVCITSPGDASQRGAVRALAETLLAEFPGLVAFVHEERKNRDSLPSGQRRVFCLNADGREENALLRLPLGGAIFEMDATSFFQTNRAAAETVAKSTASCAGGGDSLLDAYCGVGAPGLLLASRFERVAGFDLDRRSAFFARHNARRMELRHCRYVCGDAAVLLGGHKKKYDTILLDPPRAGVAPKALGNLIRLDPPRILYISCNSSTLARDAAVISKTYRLEQLTGVDLFPHTPGLECVTLWRKNMPQTKYSRVETGT
jgi:23S rRNA (uracil1939-C5)-methyltransferase